MAKFTKKEDLVLPKKYENTKIYLDADVVPDNSIITIAGHSVIDCLQIEIETVIFKNHQLTYASKLYNKTLEVEVNVSKVKTGEGSINGSTVPVTCTLTIEAGDELLETYVMDDKKNPTANSKFIFTLNLKAES